VDDYSGADAERRAQLARLIDMAEEATA
jgi:hypothetical protein